MSERGGRRSLRRNIEDEAQLLAEEKWLIDTLKKVRGQINCMQIERLHLMTLLEQYEDSVKKPQPPQKRNSAQTQPALAKDVSEASVSRAAVARLPPDTASRGRQSIGFELDEATGEELDLTVSKSVFRQNSNYTMEEFEEENDIDTEDGNENVFVDMHMLMDFQNDDNQENF